MRSLAVLKSAVLVTLTLVVPAQADAPRSPPSARDDQAGLGISDPWIREAPPGRTVLAGYAVITNRAPRELVITGAQAPGAGDIEMHRTTVEDGVMRMERVENVTLPAQGRVAFEPGGLHLMIHVDESLRVGDALEITLTTDSGHHGTARFPVLRAVGRTPAGTP